MMARWLGPDDARLERAAVYTFHSVVQEGWRKGRLLLAGDACHQTPPFLGQGMCAGMRDAANLAWKLAAIVKDGAPDALLDTYESERLPHVRTFIDLAVRLGAVLQETDRDSRRRPRPPLRGRRGNVRLPAAAARPGLPPRCAAARRHDLSPAAARRRPADGRGDRPALRHRRRGRPARRTSNRCRAAARCRPRLARTSTASRAAILRPDRYIYRLARDRQELETATLARLFHWVRPAMALARRELERTGPVRPAAHRLAAERRAGHLDVLALATWTVDTTRSPGRASRPPKLATTAASRRGAVRKLTATQRGADQPARHPAAAIVGMCRIEREVRRRDSRRGSAASRPWSRGSRTSRPWFRPA